MTTITTTTSATTSITTTTTNTSTTTTSTTTTTTTVSTTSTQATPDKRLAAYWDYQGCDPHGDDSNWEWCWKEGRFDCPESRSVSASVCPSGRALLVEKK